mmetsp:Transcript_16447/g.33557  ORF Transcript_16447/g.33557 Transcript_16447/m.33557 type:complete len:102 (-) Transcript_16447:31-336(-)
MNTNSQPMLVTRNGTASRDDMTPSLLCDAVQYPRSQESFTRVDVGSPVDTARVFEMPRVYATRQVWPIHAGQGIAIDWSDRRLGLRPVCFVFPDGRLEVLP